MQQLVLIEAPSNLGLKEPFPRVEPGVKFFPSAMEEAGFASSAGIAERVNVAAPLYSMEVHPETKVRNAGKIIQYSIKLADEIDSPILQRDLPLVIGGDCSILIGAALSLKRNGNYGLFFLDGHTDYVLPEQSGTAGAAGMDLAIVTGNGHQKLTNIENLEPYIEEKNVFCVGNREISVDWYVNAIIESDIHYYDLYSFRSKGISLIVNQFLTMIESKNLDGFWIHFDADVLDNKIMPCVDSPQEDGLSYEELEAVLNPLFRSEYFTGIDVTIYDPTLDKDAFFGKQFANQLAGIVSSVSVKDQ